MSFRENPRSEELERLEREASLLSAQIDEIIALPERLQREKLEREQTLPPPEDLADRIRESEFEEKVCRGELANRKRAQSRSLFLLFLLIAAACALLLWLVSTIQA